MTADLSAWRKAILQLVTLALVATTIVLAAPAPIASAQLASATDDAYTVVAGETTLLDVLDNDTGADRGPLSITAIVRDPADGSATITRDGSLIEFVAPVDFAGTSFIYEMTDSANNVAEATVTVAVDTTCRDITVTAAQGGDGLEAAIVSANRCPGAQTIFLERGTYETAFGFSAVEDELTITALDASVKPQIVNLRQNTFATTFRVTTGTTLTLRSLAMFDSVGAAATHVFAQNATLFVDQVDITGQQTTSTEPFTSAIRGDNAVLNVTQTTITNSDATAIAGLNGTTLKAEDITIVDPPWHGIEVDGSIDINGVNINGAGQHGINAGGGLQLAGARIWSSGDAAISFSSVESVDISATTLGLDLDDVPAINRIGITGQGPVSLTDVVIANSKEVAIETVGVSTLSTTNTSITATEVGLNLNRTEWTATTTSVEALSTSCVLFETRLTDGGDNTDTDGTCFPVPNQLPSAVGDSTAASSGETINIDVLSNDSDPDGDLLIITAHTSASARIADDGFSITYTAADDFAGETFDYTIDDGNGGTATAAVTVELVCGDVTLAEADGGPALAAAVEAADLCPGAQTIFLESGTYTLTRQLVIDDALTVQGLDPDQPSIIAIAPQTTAQTDYVFFVNDAAGTFVARNIAAVGSEQLGFAYLDAVEVTLDNVHYSGAGTDCRQGVPNAINAQGATLTLSNSEILQSHCDAIIGVGAELTILLSEIAGAAGDGIDADDGIVIVRDSALHDNGGDAITMSGTDPANELTVDNSLIYLNGGGISSTATTSVIDATIGMRPVGEGNTAAGNLGIGIDVAFADLTLERTIVSHNNAGVRAGNQSQWHTTVIDSTIESNTTYGLSIGANNNLAEAAGTTFGDNAPSCEFQGGSALSDGGGNTDDDGTCGFFVIPDTLVVNTGSFGTDTNPGDGICSIGSALPDGELECSLRAAIDESNALEGRQTVIVQSGRHGVNASIPVTDAVVVRAEDPLNPPSLIVDRSSLLSIFVVDGEAGEFEAHDLVIPANPSTSFGNFENATVVLSGIQYTGAKVGCSVGIANAMTIRGGSLTLRDSTISDASCSGVQGFLGAAVTIEDSTITGTNGQNVRFESGPLEIVRSVISGATSIGINSRGATTTVRETQVYGNGTDGIYASDDIVITDSFIGSYLDENGDMVADGNGDAGIFAVFGNLTMDNTVVANNNNWGVRSSGQTQWLTNITNSRIINNTGIGLSVGPYNSTATVADTDILGNTTACAPGRGTTINDGGGNSVDDDTCGFAVLPTTLNVIDHVEGGGRRVLATIADSSSTTTATLSSVAGSAVVDVDFENLVVERVEGGWQVVATLLDNTAADGDRSIEIEVVLSNGTVYEGTVNLIDNEAASDVLPAPFDYVDECRRRSQAVLEGFGQGYDTLVQQPFSLPGLPFEQGPLSALFGLFAPAPPIDTGCSNAVSAGSELLHAPLDYAAPIARDDVQSLVVGQTAIVNVLANDGQSEGQPLRVVPTTVSVDGFTVEIAGDGTASVSATSAGSTTVPYEVCAGDTCRMAQITVHAGATLPPIVRSDWISVNGGEDRRLSGDGRGPIDATRNDDGDSQLTVVAVDSPLLDVAAAGALVGVAVPPGQTTSETVTLSQTVCASTGACASANLYVVANPDDAPRAPRGFVALPASGSAAVDPGAAGSTGNFVIPSEHVADIAVAPDGTSFVVSAAPGFRGHASFLYETCALGGSPCGWGVIDVIAESGLAPVAGNDVFSVDVRDMYFGEAAPAYALDVVGIAGGGADAVHGGVPSIELVDGGSIMNAQGVQVATVLADPPAGVERRSHVLWVVPTADALNQEQSGASGSATYRLCVADTDLCDTATVTVTLDVVAVGTVDQSTAIPLWRVDNSGVSVEGRAPLFDAFIGDSPVIDRRNAFLLSVLSEYVYEELPGSQDSEFEDRFAAAFAGSGLSNSQFYETSDTPLGLITDAQVLVTETDEAILVVARGSESAMDWINNFTFPPEQGIHAGFKAQADAVSVRVIDDLASRPAEKPIWFAGHSLGGAVTQILASRSPRDVQGVVTFGSPAPFAAGTNPNVPPTVRYVNASDPVPSLLQELGYDHVGTEEWITANAAGCAVNGARPSSLYANFSDHSMSRYMPRMLRLLTTTNQEDMLGRYVSFDWMKWDPASGLACDAPMSVARQDVVGTWQWGSAPQDTQSIKAEEFVAGSWIVELDDRLVEVPAGVSNADAVAALTGALTWSVPAGRGDIVVDEARAVAQGLRWLYRPIAASGQTWEPSPLEDESVVLTYSGCNPWTSVCGDGAVTITFVPATNATTDFSLYSDAPVNVIANDGPALSGALAAGASINRELRSIDGEVLAPGQTMSFIGGTAAISSDGQAIALDLNSAGLRPPITVLDYQSCAQITVPGVSVRGTFESCAEDALWLFENELPSLDALDVTVGPCDAVLDPGSDLSLTTSTTIADLAGVGNQTAFPASVQSVFDFLDIGVNYRWSASGELITQLGVDESGPYLGECSGLGARLQADALITLPDVSMFEDVRAYAGGTGTFSVTPTGVNRLDGSPIAATPAAQAMMTVGADATVGPLTLDLDALLVGDQDGVRVVDTVVGGQLRLPGLGDTDGASRLDLAGTIDGTSLNLAGAGTLDGSDLFLDGFAFDNVAASFTVDTASEQLSGTVTGDVVIDVLDIDVPIVFTFDGSSWTLAANLSATDIVIGESPELLRLDSALFSIGAAGDANDATIDLSIGFEAASGELLPSAGGAVAQAAGITGLVTSSGFVTLEAASISGEFAGFGLVVSDAAFLIDADEPEGLIAEFGRIDGQIGGEDAVGVLGVSIFADGHIDIDGVCIAPESLLPDSIGAVGLPMRIIEACIVSGDLVPDGVANGSEFVTVTAELVLDSLAALSPTVTIGESVSSPGQRQPFEFSAVLVDDLTLVPWTLGPVEVAFGPTEAAGVATSGSFTVGGFTNGTYDGSLSGSGELDVDLPGVGDATFAAELSGTALLDDNGDHVIFVQASIDAAGNTSPAALGSLPIEIDSLTAVVDITARTVSGVAPTSTVEVVVSDVEGTGSLAVADGQGGSLGSAEVAVIAEGGIWDFSLNQGSTTAGDGWVTIDDATGTITVDTTADPWMVEGGFSAEARFDTGLAQPAAIGVTANSSLDGSLFAIDFAASNGAAVAAFGVDGLFATSADTPVAISGGLVIDTTTNAVASADLALGFGPTTATLFPDRPEFTVTATGLSGTLDASGIIASADEISGVFANGTPEPYELQFTGPITLDVRPAEPLFFETAEATLGIGATAITVFGVEVTKAGIVDFTGLCGSNSAGLVGETFGVAGLLPVRITEACIIGGPSAPAGVPADATYVEISGIFDFTQIDEINPYVKIGGGDAENTFTELAAIRYDDGSWALWDVSPIVLGFGPASGVGLSLAGEITLGGYGSDGFVPDVAGLASAELDLPGVAAGDLDATFQGEFSTTSTSTSLVGTVSVVATEPGEPSASPAFVSLESLDAVASLSLVAQRTLSSDDSIIWSLEPTVDVVSASGAGAVALPSEQGGQLLQARVDVSYAPGRWEFEAAAQAPTPGDLDWFVATDVEGELTIDTSSTGRHEIEGEFTSTIEIDFDGVDNGSAAIDVEASIDFDFVDGVLSAELRATNPTPQTFTIDGLLDVQGAIIELRGGASFDTVNGDVVDVSLGVDLDAAFAKLFPGRVAEGFDVTVSGIDATLSTTGLSGFATGITGTFGGELEEFGSASMTTGAATLTIDPRASEPYAVATVTGATVTVAPPPPDPGEDAAEPTVVTVGPVTVNSDRTLDIAGACAENQDGLVGQTFGIAGALPFDITQVCVLTDEGVPDDALAVMDASERFASVSGVFDFSGISELNPSITIGSGASQNLATDVFTLSVLYSDPAIGGDGSIDVWNAGPIALSFGPVSAGGITASGDLMLGGYVDGQFISDVAGTANAALDLPAAASADFMGTLTGAIDPLAGTIDARITIDGQAMAVLPGQGVGFVSLDQLYAELDVALRASVDPNGAWSTSYSVDVEMANAAGSIGLGSGDGQTFFGGEVTASYSPNRWVVTATGAAAASSTDWLGFADLAGTFEIDLGDDSGPNIAGSLQANASLDVDGTGPNGPASVTAMVDFETNGPVLSAAFSGSSVSPIDVVVDGLVAIDDVSFTLDGSIDVDIDTLGVERFDVGAEFGIGTAILFPGIDGFNVTAEQITGAVDGDGLVLGVESLEGVFGPVELEIGSAEMTLRPRATDVYDVVSVGFAELITNGVGAEVTDVVVRSDGSVSIGGFCLEGQAGIASQTFGVAGVLPFDITEACVLSDDDGTTIYSASGFFDFSQFTQALGPDAMLTGRIGSTNVTSDLDAAADTNRFTVEFIDDGDGLRPRNFGPFELEVSGVAAGPFEGSLGLYFGGYQDGVLAGSYQGEAPEVPTPLVGGAFKVSLDVDAGEDTEIGAGIGADIAGWLVTVGETTTLHLEGRIEGSGTLLVDDFGIEIVDLGADFAMQIGFNPTTNSFSEVAASFDDAGAERLLIGLGFATFEAEGVDLFPNEDDPLPAGVRSLVAVETIAMTFTDKAAVLAGWGASVDDIRVQYSDDEGLQVCAGPNFATAFQSGGEPDLFGWMPLTINDASFELPDPSPEDGCDSVIQRLGNFAEASIVASLTLGESDQWPISASVDGVGIEVALLVDYVEWLADGAQGTPPDFPITQLEGLAFGMAPTNFGPLTLGGQIGIGYIIDASGRPVWYGRLGVAADWNNIGLTLDIGASQYGPMWATISTPFTIPLGPTGFTITGIGGGLAFDRPWPTVKAGCNKLPVEGEENPSEDPDCADALDLVRADIFELKAVAPTTQAEILAMVQDKAAEVGTALDGADLAQQIWAFLPKSITLNLHGTINHATGVFDGTVTLGGNIDIGDLQFPPVEGGGAELVPDFALLGKGELSFFGFEAGELGIMMDYENPIDPTFAVALGVPGDGTLASFFPGGATFGGTLETTGMYSVWYLIARELAVQLFEKTTDLPGADTLFDDLAVRVDLDRNRPLAQLLLEGQDPDEIDGAWVQDRILALIPDTTTLPTNGTPLEDQILADLLVGGKVAEAFVTEVFDTLANGVPGGPLEPPQPPAVDAEETIAAFQAFVKDLLLDAPADGQRLLDVALATMDPKLEIVGEAGLEIFGLPVGPQQGLRLAIDKEALTFDYDGSPLALLDPRFALLVQEDTTILFNAPWDLEGLISSSLGGEPFELPLDPFSGSWGAGFDSVGTVVGLPYAAAGFVSPADNPTFVQERLAARPADALPIGNDFAQLLVANGGMLFDVALSIPDLFSDPAALADELIALGCFDNDFTALATSMTDVDLDGIDFDEINFDNIDAQDLTQLQECFVLLTKTKELGSAQLYTPNPGPALGEAFEGWAFEDGMPPELQNQLIGAFDGWYLRGEMDEFELFGFPVIDTSADPDNGTFEITEDGVVWGVQTSPFLTADEDVDDRYQVNMRLPFLSGEGEPLPVSFDVIETPVGPAVVPALGGSWTFKGNQISGLMDTLGLAPMVPSGGSVTLRAYTPGYDRKTPEDDLRNTGGVQVATSGPIGGSFGGLVEAEKDAVATATLTMTPPSAGNLIGADVAGEIVVEGDISLGAVTLAGGTLGLEYTGGIAPTVTVAGAVDLDELGEFTATGTIDPNVPRADLTLVTDSLQLNDDISIAGTLSLETVGTTWQIVATNATLTVGTWRDFDVDSVTIASDGSFAIDELVIGDIATPDDPLFIDGFGLSVAFNRTKGLSGSLLGNLVMSLDTDTTIEIDLAKLDLAAGAIPVSGTGAFGRTFTADLAAGELDFGSATVSLGRTSAGVWYAELDARLDLGDVGIDGEIAVDDLRVDSTGTIAGQATLDTTWPVQVVLPLEIITISQAALAPVIPVAAPVGPPVLEAATTRVIEFRVGESYVRTDGTWLLDLDSLPQVKLGGASSFASPVRLDNGQLAGQVLTNGEVIVAFSGDVTVTPLDLTVSGAGSLNTETRAFSANIGTELIRFGPLSLEGGASVAASPQSWSLEFESGSTAALDGWGSVTTESGTTIDSDGGFKVDLAFDDMGNEDNIVRFVSPRLHASYEPGEELDVRLDGAVQLAIDLPGSGKRYPCVRFGDADVPSGSTTASCTSVLGEVNFSIPTGSNGEFSHEFAADLQLGDWDFGDASVTFARHGDAALSLMVNGTAAITLFQGNYVGDVLPAGIAPIIGGSVELVDVGFVRRSNGSTFVSGTAKATLDVALSEILPGLQWTSGVTMGIATRGSSSNRRIELTLGDASIDSNGAFNLGVLGSLFDDPPNDLFIVETFPASGTVSVGFDVDVVDGFSVLGFGFTSVDLVGCSLDGSSISGSGPGFTASAGEGRSEVVCTAEQTTVGDVVLRTETLSFDIVVVREPPIIQFDKPDDVEVFVNATTDAADVNYPGFDIESGTALCSPTSGSSFAVGITPVMCTASNADGSTPVVRSFDVTVTQSLTAGFIFSNVAGSLVGQETAYAEFGGTPRRSSSPADATDPLTRDANGKAQAPRGEKVRATGADSDPGTSTVAWLRSEPVFLGETIVDPDGRWTLDMVIPTDMPLGSHTLILVSTGRDGQRRLDQLSIEVVAASQRAVPSTSRPITPSEPPTPVDPVVSSVEPAPAAAGAAPEPQPLAHTGSSTQLPAQLGLALVGFGALLLGCDRRRRRIRNSVG